MNSINCGGLFQAIGWYCRVISTGSGTTTYVSTPITLPGGKPLDFYLTMKGSLIEFTDDGTTMFALRNLSYKLNDKRNWKGLENIASKFGFTLTDNGSFESIFPSSELEEWGAKIIRLFTSIAAWEEERFAEGDTDFSLTEEVAALLRAKAPDRHLTINPTVKVGKFDASFDFLWGDTYVDAIRPIQQTVNSRLRKALLVNRSADNLKILFIIDDRKQTIKAEEEMAVLGEISRTVKFSDFASHYSPSTH